MFSCKCYSQINTCLFICIVFFVHIVNSTANSVCSEASGSMSVSSSWREFFGRPQIGPVLDWLSFPTDAQLFPWKHQLLSSWGFSLHLSDWDSFSYIPCLPLPWFTFSFQYYLQEGCVGNAFFVTSRT